VNDPIVLYGVGAYLLLNIAVGLWAGRHVASGADFIVAGRRLPLWLATATLFATWFGGGTCIGAAGEAYDTGVLGVIADPFGAALCLFLAGWFFVRPLRRMGLLTIGDFFRERFGARSERIAAVLQVPPFIGWVAAQFVAFGTVLHALGGVDQTAGIVVGFAVVLAYTVTGGMWAVSITDFLQAVVLIAGLVWLLPNALADAGGWSAVAAALPAGHTDLLPETSFHGWIWYAQAWLVIGIGSIPSQDLLQRSFSAKDERTAAWSAYLSGAMYLSVGLIPVALGLIARVTLPGLADPELALPLLGRGHLGSAGMAVFVGALLSAILSTADSALLAPASVFSENLVRPLRPGMSDAGLLRTTRLSVAAFAVIALLLALEFRDVYELMLGAMEAGLAGLAAPFAAGLYWKRIGERAANAAMLGGTGAWLVLTALTDEWPADLLGFLVSLAILWLFRNRALAAMPGSRA
jgi:SSS family transporter